MISIEDIIGMTDLTREEIGAIAEHEHMPEVTAAPLADYLMHEPKGPQAIRQMIIDDIRLALERGHTDHARELLMALRHFLQEHQDALSRQG